MTPTDRGSHRSWKLKVPPLQHPHPKNKVPIGLNGGGVEGGILEAYIALG